MNNNLMLEIEHVIEQVIEQVVERILTQKGFVSRNELNVLITQHLALKLGVSQQSVSVVQEQATPPQEPTSTYTPRATKLASSLTLEELRRKNADYQKQYRAKKRAERETAEKSVQNVETKVKAKIETQPEGTKISRATSSVYTNVPKHTSDQHNNAHIAYVPDLDF